MTASSKTIAYIVIAITLLRLAENVTTVLKTNGSNEITSRLLYDEESFLSSSTTSTTTTTTAYTGQNGFQCISNEELDYIIQSAQQIFVATQKFAESFFDNFLNEHCMKEYNYLSEKSTNGNNNNNDNIYRTNKTSQAYITKNYKLPPIISSHLESQEALINLIRGITDESLMIYIHRKETDRLSSSIKHFAKNVLCEKKRRKYKSQVEIKENGSQCIIEENALLDLVLKEADIGAAHTFFTCTSFDVIDSTLPNMIIVNHDQIEKLQKVLAKHYCPEMLDPNGNLPEDLIINPSEEKIMSKDSTSSSSSSSNNNTIKIKLNDKQVRKEINNGEVELDEWIEKKRHHLHWGFNMKKNTSCQSRIREMDEETNYCAKGMIKFDENYERASNSDALLRSVD